MNTGKTNANTDVAQLADQDLEKVTGGLLYFYDSRTGKYYQWDGGYSFGKKYVCPNCGRPVSSTFGIRYDCDHCDASWVFEKRLYPNVDSGLWTEISEEEYDRVGGSSGGHTFH